MYRHALRHLVAPALAASLVLASAGVAAADEPPAFTVDPFFCAVTDENGDILPENVVPAGSQIFIFQGWVTATKGQLTSFMNLATWLFEVNHQPVDVGPYLTGMFNFYPGGPWADFLIYDAGTLAAGESIETNLDWTLQAAHFDGSIHFKQGPVPGGAAGDCVVSAAP